MKNSVKIRIVFIALSLVILIASVLPVIISNNTTITANSSPAIAFGVCSVIYAVIAFVIKDEQNLFVLGKNRFFLAFLRSMRGDTPDTDSEEYKKEFALSAFIFCASIPLYIPLAFFANSFYAALSSALSVTIVRLLATILFVIVPRLIKKSKDQKSVHIKEEADRREQERRESMGKWK